MDGDVPGTHIDHENPVGFGLRKIGGLPNAIVVILVLAHALEPLPGVEIPAAAVDLDAGISTPGRGSSA